MVSLSFKDPTQDTSVVTTCPPLFLIFRFFSLKYVIFSCLINLFIIKPINQSLLFQMRTDGGSQIIPINQADKHLGNYYAIFLLLVLLDAKLLYNSKSPPVL